MESDVVADWSDLKVVHCCSHGLLHWVKGVLGYASHKLAGHIHQESGGHPALPSPARIILDGVSIGDATPFAENRYG